MPASNGRSLRSMVMGRFSHGPLRIPCAYGNRRAFRDRARGRDGFRIARLGSDELWSARETGYALHPLGDYWLLTGRNLDLIAAEERAIERALAVAVFLSLALGVFGGLVLTRYVGRRLDGIAKAIEAAGEGDLSRRVDMVAGGGDAFDRLAARLNVMLGKLEGVMAELRIVTDSLAHDLRSPLARLRTKTEQAVLISDPDAREAAL
ncbi:MAG: methyl-accepting chemotaxis protein, partial [Comamonadaceae bacterium]